MALPSDLSSQLSLPVLCAPMYIVSTPKLVYAQCINGLIGSFPALNARPQGLLDEWLSKLTQDLQAYRQANPDLRVAFYAVNQIIHKTNERLGADFDICEKHRVPLIITSLRAPNEFVPRVHGWGGRIFHDVTTLRHAEKALEAGVDGLILVCTGAGGHAGILNPLAFVAEIRRIYTGPIVLSGAITGGAHILAALTMGADLAYMGTRFIATQEANASAAYKQMIVDSSASDIVYTPYFSGTPGSYLRQSITAAGLDPNQLVRDEGAAADMLSGIKAGAKTWLDIWSAGQGVGGISDIPEVSDLVHRLREEFAQARTRMAAF